MVFIDDFADGLRKRAEIRLKSTCRGGGDRLAKQLIEAADIIEGLQKELVKEIQNKKEFERDWLEALDELHELKNRFKNE